MFDRFVSMGYLGLGVWVCIIKVLVEMGLKSSTVYVLFQFWLYFFDLLGELTLVEVKVGQIR